MKNNLITHTTHSKELHRLEKC